MARAQPLEALSQADVWRHLSDLAGWQQLGEHSKACIEKTFHFADYDATMAFVNAVAAVAKSMNHHPELVVGFNRCAVRYQTHDVQGISHLDFAAARQVEDLAART